MFSSFFFFNDTATTEIYTLSLHDALPIFAIAFSMAAGAQAPAAKSIKMQSTWPASNTLQEHFKMFAERVDKLTQGGIKIEAMPAGQIGPPLKALDAAHKKGRHGRHPRTPSSDGRTRPPGPLARL